MARMNDQNMDPTTAYTLLGPAQRSALAQAFIDEFRRCGDPGAQEFARVDPHYVSAAQLAEMHEYAADAHPDILAKVMKDPEITAALGSFATLEAEQLTDK